jgi:hypothetical protein
MGGRVDISLVAIDAGGGQIDHAFRAVAQRAGEFGCSNAVDRRNGMDD